MKNIQEEQVEYKVFISICRNL